jgi:hypothetical protein
VGKTRNCVIVDRHRQNVRKEFAVQFLCQRRTLPKRRREQLRLERDMVESVRGFLNLLKEENGAERRPIEVQESHTCKNDSFPVMVLVQRARDHVVCSTVSICPFACPRIDLSDVLIQVQPLRSVSFIDLGNRLQLVKEACLN